MTRPSSLIASVRLKDPGYITVTVLQEGIRSESSANRLQMNTVSCTWYKPSRTAWLHYSNTGKARAAERFIASRDFRIAGRKIQAVLQIPRHRFMHGKPTFTSVQLGNLDVSTSQPMVERHIPNHLTPADVVMGKASYSTSSQEAEESVKALLDAVGPLEAWEPNSTTSATQVKAIARFQTAEHARNAVNRLSGHKMPQLASSKLLVSPLVSVKFNVPKAMYGAIRGDVDHLRSQIWDTGHVHIKSHPPVDLTQKLIALSIKRRGCKGRCKSKECPRKDFGR